MSIGIVGAGISGIHLALRLQQLGVPATVYPGRTPDAMRADRPRAFPSRFAATQAREAELGVAHWPGRVAGWDFVLHGRPPLAFHADLAVRTGVVDFRIYLPRLLEDFAARGGEVRLDLDPVERLAERHDLVVVANGDRSMATLFPAVGDLSPYDAPQRLLCCGIYAGIGADKPDVMDVQFLPGVAEVLRFPWLHPGGVAHVLAFESIPGGPLAGLSGLDPAADPAGFDREILDALATWFPALREQVDEAAFGLIGPDDLVRGGLVPVVRRGWARVTDQVGALAIGDAWITNDPLAAQGANLGSWSAFAAADLIAAGAPPYDEAFCRAVSDTLWEHASSVVGWSNAFLAEPPPHAISLFAAAAQDPGVADAFANAFDDPELMWRTLSGPPAVAGFIAANRTSGARSPG